MNLERMQLEYLARATQPVWGGHLQRGERISDPDMQRWLGSGWIEAVGTEGYRITDKGRRSPSNTHRERDVTFRNQERNGDRGSAA